MRILSLCRDAIPCEFATRLAVDAGCIVIKAEEAAGDPLRTRLPGLAAWLCAEVIRIENRAHLDIHRRGGPYAGGKAGLDRSGTWNAQNRGKLGCTLDVTNEEGRALFLDLAARSDVIIENFSPGTLEKWSLGFEALRAVSPRIVVLRLSGYGQTGPWRDSLAYGPMMDAATGLSAVTTYGDGLPRAVNGWAADIGGALHGCAAVTRALLAEPRVAMHLDVSQFEAGVLFNAAALIEQGNPATPPALPVLQAAVESRETDRWIAVSARAGDELEKLCALIGAAAPAQPAPDALPAIEAALQAWAATHDQGAALQALAAAGVPAVPVTTTRELIGDGRVHQRGTWIDIDHPEAGRMTCYGGIIRLEGAASGTRPAPRLGEHNDHVFGTLLDLSATRIAELAGRGVL